MGTYSGIPVLSFFFSSLFSGSPDDGPDLTPFKYTSHRVLSVKRISSQHVLIDIQISQRSKEAFSDHVADDKVSATRGGSTLDIRHVYVKSPDLQIERPYTPINDVKKDGYIRLLVKRVKGGEVGRFIHSLNEGDDIEIRGPIKTVSIPLQSLDHLTMISTGTGVAPFLQLICKVASIFQETTPADGSAPASMVLPKLSLIQYLPRNSQTAPMDAPPATTPSRSISDSIPVEEFSDAESTLDAGPDIIRHPEVLSPTLRKHLVDKGALRLLRLSAARQIDQSLVMDSFTASGKADVSLTLQGIPEEQAEGGEKGSWFGWFSPMSSTPSAKAKTSQTGENVRLHDGKIGEKRVGVMACLPVQSLIPLAGPQYPMGRTKPAIAGVLGSIGFNRDNVWIL